MAIYNIQGVKKYDEDLETLLDEGLGTSAEITVGRENYDFRGLCLDGIKLNNRVLDGHYFDECTFKGADLSGCTFSFGHLRECDFTGANLKGVQFLNCNMRHSVFSWANIQGGEIKECMMRSVNFRGANLTFVDFEGSDLRCADFREANCRQSRWHGARFVGCDWRATILDKTNGLPLWMKNQKNAYDLMPPKHKCMSWKLVGEGYRGIYRPHIVYEVGKSFEATRGGVSPIHATKNPGIALAPLTWCLQEWITHGASRNSHLLMVEFNAGDVISDSIYKFTVSKLKVLKEVDLMTYVRDIGEADAETLQVR